MIDLKHLLEATVLRLPASSSLLHSWRAYIAVSLASGCPVSQEIYARVLDNVPPEDKDMAAAFLEWMRERYHTEMQGNSCNEAALIKVQ